MKRADCARHHPACAPPVSFSLRRQKTLLADPGLTIVPPGPGWPAFSISMALLGVILCGVVYWANQLTERGDPGVGATVVPEKSMLSAEQGQKHILNRTLVARAYLEPDPDLGVLDNFTRWLPHDTDGVVEPLWPWLAARLAARDHLLQETRVSTKDRQLFHKGRWMNVWIAVAFLAVLGLVAAKTFSPAAAAAVLLAAAFGALLPRAIFFRPDMLNYIFVFLAWLCAIRLLFQNSVSMHGVFGALAGFAWLTDSTGWIVVAAWFIASGCRWLRAAVRRQDSPAEESWICRNHFVGLIALALGWLAVAGPRCAAAAGQWGNPFHTAQQTWMWADSAEEAWKWTRVDAFQREAGITPAAGDRPGWNRYRKTHSTGDAAERLTSGMRGVWQDFWAFDEFEPGAPAVSSPRLLKYRGAFLAGAAVLFLAAWTLSLSRQKSVDRGGLRLPSGAGAAAFFVVLASAGYSLWYGWYRPIDRDDGYLLVLYLPLFFSFVWGAERLIGIARMRGLPRWQWIGTQLLMGCLGAAIAAGAIVSMRTTDSNSSPPATSSLTKKAAVAGRLP
jgi:hypothetical protein